HQDKGSRQSALGGVVPDAQVFRAAQGVVQHAVVQVDLGQSGDGPQDNVLDARLGGGGDGDGVAVTAQAVRRPQDVDLLDGRLALGFAAVRDCGAVGHGCFSCSV